MREPEGLGRDFLTEEGPTLAVRRYRDRLLGRLGLEAGKGRRALDLGCGDGMEAVWLAERGWKVEAFDLESHPRWQRLAKESKGRIRFATADAAQLGSLKKPYDLVFQKDMLHHVPDPEAVLRAMKRLTAPGGTAVVLECNRLNPIFYGHLTLMRGHQHFTLPRLRALLQTAGMGSYSLKRIEARVWPLESLGFQNLMERMQDLAEALPFWRPFICYHAALWKPEAGSKKGMK
ncbi:MAG: class I SAM-dependent methyltransferase [candidate division FCPU426 bacterium]